MSTELVYRMRTCAAFIMNRPNDAPIPTEHLLDDAADLLLEASNLLDVELEEPISLGEPMDVLQAPAANKPIAQWGGQLDATARACPSCGSVDARSVRRDGRRLMLTCPKCASTWEYGK